MVVNHGQIGGKRASGLLIVFTTTDAGLDTQAKGSSALLVLLQPALLASLATTEGESTGKPIQYNTVAEKKRNRTTQNRTRLVV